MIDFIESSALATWIRESTSIFAYTSILSLHAIGLAIVVGLNSVIALRLLGFAPGIPLAPTLSYFPLMYAGFWVNAVSGLLLLAAHMSSILSNTMFFLKLGFIALAVLALRLIRNVVYDDAAVLAGGAIPAKARALAWASLVFWTFAIITGRLTEYPYFVQAWFGI